MKRLIVLFIIAIMTFSLCACNGGDYSITKNIQDDIYITERYQYGGNLLQVVEYDVKSGNTTTITYFWTFESGLRVLDRIEIIIIDKNGNIIQEVG